MSLAAAAGQLNPSALTATKLYTATATITTLRVVVVNRAAVQTTFRISKRVAGAAANDKQFNGGYDTPIDGNDIYESPTMVLAATDEVWVYATDATLAFNVEGIEQS